ncbi:MAG: hypothetical protein JWO60_185 [Frankiales bacterium]|nr:hypothetical protein [Frankiales bacterium]
MTRPDDSSPYVGYHRRKVTVAPDLNALDGPLTGHLRLPLHLDSSARSLYDFTSVADRDLAYRVVLLEAHSSNDLEQWLHRRELLRLWPDLYLPRHLRRAWEEQHPVLSQIGAGPHVPQV